MGIQLKWAFALCLAVCAAQTGSADDRPLYKNPMAPVSARVEDLLGRMTLQEKVAQLEAVWQGKIAIFDEKVASAPELLKSSLNSKEPQYVQHTLAQDFNDCHRSRDCDSLRLCDIACHGRPSAASDFARSSATVLAPSLR